MTDVFGHPWLSGLYGDDQIAAIWSPDAQLAHMLRFESVWSDALGATGLAEPAMAAAAAKSISAAQIDIADLQIGSGRDGLPVPALVKQLKTIAGENAAAVHKGATSQDVIDTALSLTIQANSAALDTGLITLSAALNHLSSTFGDGPLMGRTRMQAALPITVADRIAPWLLPLDDHRTRLTQMCPRLEVVQIGGAAGDRAALGDAADAVAAHVANALGLHNPPRAWHTMRDGIAEYAGLLSLISGTLGKMGQDICLMAQGGEIAISGGGGSSAMPHKQNPILAELLVTLARFNAVQLSGMHQALIHEQERSGAAWSLEHMILPQMAMATGRGLTAATTLIGRIERVG